MRTKILATCTALLFGAHQTTSTVITHGLALLLRHPEQLALLRAEPDRTPAAIEEIVRFEGPSKAVARVSLEPLTIAGHDFPAGQRFLLSLQYANLRILLDRLPNLHPADDEQPELTAGRQFGHHYSRLPVRF